MQIHVLTIHIHLKPVQEGSEQVQREVENCDHVDSNEQSLKRMKQALEDHIDDRYQNFIWNEKGPD